MTVSTDPISPAVTRSKSTWILLVVAAVFATGSLLQLFLAGLSTFDSGTYWSDHVFLGRIVSLFALVLPLLAWFVRMSRSILILSGIAAALYMIQVMLTYINIGPLAALHALNAFPLIIIPGIVTLRAWELLRTSSRLKTNR